MRQVIHGDVTAVVRAMLAVAQPLRQSWIGLVIETAHAADIYRKHYGRAHCDLGNGSLAGVVSSMPKLSEPLLSDPECCECYFLVFEGLMAWQNDRARLNHGRRTHKSQ